MRDPTEAPLTPLGRLRRSRLGPAARWALRRWPFLRSLLFGQYDPHAPLSYRRWVKRHDRLTAGDREAIAAHIAALPRQVISLVVPDAGPHLAAVVASVTAQFYPHWELLLPGKAAATPDPRIRPLAAGDPLAQVAGEIVALLPPDAELAPEALYEVAACFAADPDAEVACSDEDRRDRAGRRRAPLCKGGVSPDLLLGRDMFGDLLAARQAAWRRAGGLGEPAARHDRALRLIEAVPPARIRHIPAILVHRRAPDGFAPAETEAVVRHLARSGMAGAWVEANPRLAGTSRVRLPLPDPVPKVSVIVPTRDRAALLARCAEGVLHRTDYPDLELLIVDNGSTEADTLALFARLAADPRVRVLPFPGPFNFARLNNEAAAAARGAVLLLLNNDVDVIHPEWLAEMVGRVMRPDVGAVGARLLYGDGRLQHGGIALGVSGVAGHLDLLEPRAATGLDGRLALARDVAAVTAACLAIRREVYLAAGGMDAEHLAVAYNDVDLCLRLRARGLRVVVTPFAELFHLESASRPPDLGAAQRARYRQEVAFMRDRWGATLRADPFYPSPFSLRDGHWFLAAPRRRAPWRTAAPSVAPTAAASATRLAARHVGRD